MGEHRDHGGKEPEGDVPRHLAAAKAEHGRGHEADKAEEERTEQGLSHSDQSMTDRFDGDPPSDFVAEWAARIVRETPARRRALDIATGRGRHALLLAGLGLRVFGVDANCDALHIAKSRAISGGLRLALWCADLTSFSLPRRAFDLIVVTRYLQRDLFPAIRESLSANGVVIYETFTVNQRALGFGPTSPDHLLHPGELRDRFAECEILFYEEVTSPAAVARIVARRSA